MFACVTVDKFFQVHPKLCANESFYVCYSQNWQVIIWRTKKVNNQLWSLDFGQKI